MLKFLKQRFFGTTKTNPRGQTVRLTLEEFEPRFLPNASPLFAGVQSLGFGGPLATAGVSAGTNFTASLSGVTGAAGTASYNANAASSQNSLSLQVTGLTANATYTVQINGTTVGQLTTNASGSAQLSLSNISPTVAAGSVISVLDSTGTTDLQGTFASTGCSSGSSSGTSSSSTGTSITGTSAISSVSTDTQIATDASTFAQALLSGSFAGALAALNDFEAYLSTNPSVSLQELEALTFLDQVFADLA